MSKEVNLQWFCLGIIFGHLNMNTIRFYFKKNEQNHIHAIEELKVLESTIEFVRFYFPDATFLLLGLHCILNPFSLLNILNNPPVPLYVMKT